MPAINRLNFADNVDAATALYIGQLEASVAGLVASECKYRAVMELVTGEAWDSTPLVGDQVNLQQVAADIVVKQTGMEPDKALLLVQNRTTAPVVQTLEDPVNTTARIDMAERVKSWKLRNQAANQ